MTNKLSIINTDTKPWYHQGLRFKCTECGQCCTGAPGHVWVSVEEIDALAALLGLTRDAFGAKYLRRIGDDYALLERGGNHDCIFLRDRKCSVYSARPKQCRTFPWWASNLESPEAWKRAAKDCEGIRDDAPLVPLETVEQYL